MVHMISSAKRLPDLLPGASGGTFRNMILSPTLVILFFASANTNPVDSVQSTPIFGRQDRIPSRRVLVLRGGGSESADFSIGGQDFSLGSEHTSQKPAEKASQDDSGGKGDDEFSIGTFDPDDQKPGQSAETTAKGPGAGVSLDMSNEDDDDLDLEAFGDAVEIYDDDIDKVVGCEFQRVGDTNGVFFHLGTSNDMQSPDRRFTQGHGGDSRGRFGRPSFSNPALTGRVRILAGPLRAMCAEKLQGKPVQPEDVLERNVVGDEFWFPDGWFAVDLGNHTRLKPSSYMMRNGGGTAEVTTGWMLEAANHVEGKWWRVGDWEVIDRHENDTSFLELAEDGSAPGWVDSTRMPTRVDHRSGEEVPAIHRALQWTWRQEPIGELPHHTLSFDVAATKAYRYFRLRQLTNHLTSHCNHPPSTRNFYVQGFEMYGRLYMDHQQEETPPFKQRCPRGQWYWGLTNPERDSEEDPRWGYQWLRGEADMTERDKVIREAKSKWVRKVRELFVDPPPPRTWDKPDFM